MTQNTIHSGKNFSSAKMSAIVFQLLLFCSILLSIAASLYLGGVAALLVSLACVSAAFAYYCKTTGFDARALFACALFFLLSLFFIASRFLPTYFSFALVPVVALAFSALILAFRLFVYDKKAEGIVVGHKGRLVLVEVAASPWHSLSGVQVVETPSAFQEGAKVGLLLRSGFFSQPHISKIHHGGLP